MKVVLDTGIIAPAFPGIRPVILFRKLCYLKFMKFISQQRYCRGMKKS